MPSARMEAPRCSTSNRSKGGGIADRAAEGTFVARPRDGEGLRARARHPAQGGPECGRGYASGPVSLAAALMGVPIAVLEPNSVVGLANRLLAPFARRAYVAWDEAGARFQARGAPTPRRAAPPRGSRRTPYAARGTARVLVMGGSRAPPRFDDQPACRSRAGGHATCRPSRSSTRQAGTATAMCAENCPGAA